MQLKKGFILQSKGGLSEKKFVATLCATKLLSFHLAALHTAQHGPLHFRFASYAYVLTWCIVVSSKLLAFDSMGIHGGVVRTS